jgi:hypothetical protein
VRERERLRERLRLREMSQDPTFEAACRTLEDMFPDLDPIVVRSVLDAKDGDMNSSCEKLLKMSQMRRVNAGQTASVSAANGYGDAPRLEQMGASSAQSEDVNPYSRDARFVSIDHHRFVSSLLLFVCPRSENDREVF